ncbi:ribosome recycling factor [Geminicoccaceae bacterium 1502E]|nr:ribosome recycling factor [Geminicoccaceae bacterium 1502E]
MSNVDPDIGELERRMSGALDALRKELQGLRTGRASASLLEPVTVEAYGAMMPLNQVATVNVPEPRMLTVQVWDRGMIKAVEKAIRNAGLGLNPVGEGQLLRVPLPDLSQERRAELVKSAHRYAEQARVAVRNVRRDGMDMLKKMERDGDLSQDDHKIWSDEVQALTDRNVEAIGKLVEQKEKDILTV